MIVREICKEQYTEQVFQSFDYFNDFDNTWAFVKSMARDAKTPEEKERLEGIAKRLEEGNEAFKTEYWSRIQRRLNEAKEE